MSRPTNQVAKNSTSPAGILLLRIFVTLFFLFWIIGTWSAAGVAKDVGAPGLLRLIPYGMSLLGVVALVAFHVAKPWKHQGHLTPPAGGGTVIHQHFGPKATPAPICDACGARRADDERSCRYCGCSLI